MDEIQNCIADAQYGEALRGMEQIRPVDKFPDPGPDFDAAKFAQQERITLKKCVSEPLGAYFLKRFAGEGPQEEVFESLEGIRNFRRNPNKDAQSLIDRALRRLPIKFKRLNSFEELKNLADEENGDGTEARDGSNLLVSKDSDLDDEQPAEAKSSEGATDIDPGAAPKSNVDESALNTLEEELIRELEKFWEPFQEDALFDRYCRLKWYANLPVTLKDFTIFRDLGRGAFGVVSGARLNTTGSMVAIKYMNRKLVKGKKATKLVKAEKEVLEVLGEKPSPFTIWLKYAWSDKEMYYLAIPLATGGDLLYHLSNQGYFDVERARFTGAEIAIGLNHLHSLGIIYRDLKPENVLLDDRGHARISDMGLAIVSNGRLVKGRAGTPGYWAPEMLQKQRYGVEVDWWSLGCVLFEMLSGRCPFSKQNTKMERDEATLHWELKFPEYLGFEEKEPWPQEASDLCSQLLSRSPKKRLGYGASGYKNISRHPFFASLDFPAIEAGQVEPPWVPRKEAIHAVNQSELDEKNNEFNYRKIKLDPSDDIPNFQYKSEFAHQNDIITVLELEARGELEYLDKMAPPGCCSIC